MEHPPDADRIAHLLRSRIRLSHLVLLDRIATAGSLHRGAAAHGVSQPAVTKSVREIEAVLGSPIFERSRSGVRVTKFGEQLVAGARAVISEIDRLSLALVAAAHGYDGLLRVGHIPFVSYAMLSSSMELLALEARVTFQLSSGTSNEVLAALKDRHCDCGLIRYVGSGASDEFIFDELYKQRAALVCSRDSKLSSSDVQFDALADERVKWILPPRLTPTRLAVDRLFISGGFGPRVPEVECFDVRMIQLLLSQDPSRVAVLPEDVAREMSEVRPLIIAGAYAPLDLPPICFARTREMDDDPRVAALLRAIRFRLSNENPLRGPKID